MIVRPTVTGTMRARKTKKTQGAVSAKQIAGYIVVAAVTSWLTVKLNDLIEQRLGPAEPTAD